MGYIGILTSGGDCPGLNAVIRAVVKSAVMVHGWEVIGIENGFAGLLSGRLRRLTVEDVRGILPRGGTILGASNRENPFAIKVVENGHVKIHDASDRVVEVMHGLGLRAVVSVGGDGTMRITRELSAKGAPFVGVPKTIDNDVPSTDVTFGFDTALAIATDAVDRLHSTAESHHRTMVVEVMGRDAGWIALHAGIAGGADVILIPEISFRLEEVAAKVTDRARAGRPFTVVVVAEGAYPEGGSPMYQSGRNGDRVRLGGIGGWVAEQLMERFRLDARNTALGYIQRGGSPTPFDRLLATRLGAAAVEAIASGRVGTMVAVRGDNIVPVPLEQVAREPRRVDPRGELVRVARGLGISFAAQEGSPVA